MNYRLLAKVLGLLGEREVVPDLLEALAKVDDWDPKILQGNMAEYAHLPTPVDALILAGAPLRGFEAEDVDGVEPKLLNVIETYRRGAVDTAIALTLELPLFQPAVENPEATGRMAEMVRDNFGGWLQSFPLTQWDSTKTVDRIGEISIPTLVIVGDKDVQSIRVASDSLAAGITGARTVSIENGTHHMNMEEPEVFNAAVMGFLEGLHSEQ